MKLDLIFELARSYFFSARANSLIKKIALISLTSLAVSVLVSILVLSVMKSLNYKVRSRLLDSEPHLVIHFPNTSSIEELQNLPIIQKVKKFKVKRYFPSTRFDLILRTWNGRFHGVIAQGFYQSDLDWVVAQFQKNSSPKDDFTLDSKQILLGADLLDTLGAYTGDTVYAIRPQSLVESSFSATGIQSLEVKGSIRSQIPDVDSTTLYFNLDNTANYFGEMINKNMQYLIWLEDPNLVAMIKQELLPLAYGRIETWQERNAAIFFALKLEKTLIAICVSLAVIVAMFAAVMAMGLLFSHKKREFWIIKVLGCSPIQFRSLFLGITTGFGGLGLFLGVIGGAAVSVWLHYYPLRILPDIYYDNEISADLDLIVVVTFLTLGLLFLTSVGLRFYTQVQSDSFSRHDKIL